MKRYDSAKRARTCLAKYGREHPMQCPEVRRRAQRRYSCRGVRFDSSYELAFYVWLSDNGFDFEYQPDVSFEYSAGDRKARFYQPDFRVEGFLYELKGSQFVGEGGRWVNPYSHVQDCVYEAKRRCCLTHGVKIITQCQEFLDYVSAKYGRDFVRGCRVSSPPAKAPSKAELNPYFRNRRLNLGDIRNNPYYQRDSQKFDQLRALVEAYPKSYQRKLDATGKKRELAAGVAPSLPYAGLRLWMDGQLPALASPEYRTPTKVAWILLGIEDFPKCEACGRRDGYVGRNVCVARPYGPYCCRECAYRSESKNRRARETKLRRYGSETYTNPGKVRATVEAKLAADPGFYAKVVRKRRATCMERYGVDNPMKCQAGKGALVESVMERYGVPFYACLDDMRRKTSGTCMERYGARWFTQTDDFRRKSARTMVERYGVAHSGQSPEIRRRSRQKYLLDGMYFASAPEVAFYAWHRDSGISIECQPDCGLVYEHGGVVHAYHPDFRVGDVLYEIKGDQFANPDGTWRNPYRDPSWTDERYADECAKYEAKRRCCARNGVRVLYHADYAQYVEYVRRRYGRGYFKGLKL